MVNGRASLLCAIPMKMNRVWLFLLVTIWVADPARAATATNIQANGTIGYWTNNANWNAAGYPGSGANESAFLTTNAAIAYTNILDVTLGATIDTLAISNASGVVCLVITNATLTNNTMIVGKGGRLWLYNGAIFTNTTALTMYAAGGGQIEVNRGATLFPGAVTFGTLNQIAIRGAGALLKGGSIGVGSSDALLIDNYAVATNMIVGLSGPRGRIEVTGGGKLYSTNFLTIGTAVASVCNTALVSGVDSIWNMGGMNLWIGNACVSNRLIVADNGVMTNVGNIWLGVVNAAADYDSLTITNNGKLYSAGGVVIGYEGHYDAGMVSGTGSVWDAGYATMSVGAAVTATGCVLRIDRTGTVQRVGDLTIKATNTLQLFGGLLSASNVTCNGNPLFIGDGSQNAELRLLGGTATALSGVVVRANGILTGRGTFNGGIYGVVITNDAAIEPGVLTPGIITNVGDLTLAADSISWFKILTNSVAGAGWDRIVVTNGVLTLGGYLKPVLPGEFKPFFSNSFIIFSNRSADKITGAFNNGGGDRVNVYDINRLRKTGTFRIGISNQYVVLDSYRPYSGGMVLLIK